MTNLNGNGSPLTAATGATDSRAAEAFELLANEMRLAILFALWDARAPFEGDSGVPFSELRDRVGRPDSGQFNYHLGKLEEQFVEATEDGYKLRPAGDSITRAVIAGTGLADSNLAPTEIGLSCPLCDAPTAITYRHGRLFQVCTECGGKYGERDEYPRGTLSVWRLHPAGVANRTPQEVYAAASIGMLHRGLAMIDRVCPDCSGAVDSDLLVCDDHTSDPDEVCPNCGRKDDIMAVYQCTVCKYSTAGPPSSVVSQHPAVISFYYDHGVDFQYNLDFQSVTRMFELEEAHEQTIASTDPIRVRVTIQFEGDELTLVLDENLTVREVVE